MTEQEYKAAHIELWRWLYDNPAMEKEDWPGWNKYEYNASHCFACKSVNGRCRLCPIVRKMGRGCNHDDSIWFRWVDARYPGERKKYAAIIRDAWREIP